MLQVTTKHGTGFTLYSSLMICLVLNAILICIIFMDKGELDNHPFFESFHLVNTLVLYLRYKLQ